MADLQRGQGKAPSLSHAVHCDERWQCGASKRTGAAISQARLCVLTQPVPNTAHLTGRTFQRTLCSVGGSADLAGMSSLQEGRKRTELPSVPWRLQTLISGHSTGDWVPEPSEQPSEMKCKAFLIGHHTRGHKEYFSSFSRTTLSLMIIMLCKY